MSIKQKIMNYYINGGTGKVLTQASAYGNAIGIKTPYYYINSKPFERVEDYCFAEKKTPIERASAIFNPRNKKIKALLEKNMKVVSIRIPLGKLNSIRFKSVFEIEGCFYEEIVRLLKFNLTYINDEINCFYNFQEMTQRLAHIDVNTITGKVDLLFVDYNSYYDEVLSRSDSLFAKKFGKTFLSNINKVMIINNRYNFNRLSHLINCFFSRNKNIIDSISEYLYLQDIMHIGKFLTKERKARFQLELIDRLEKEEYKSHFVTSDVEETINKVSLFFYEMILVKDEEYKEIVFKEREDSFLNYYIKESMPQEGLVYDEGDYKIYKIKDCYSPLIPKSWCIYEDEDVFRSYNKEQGCDQYIAIDFVLNNVTGFNLNKSENLLDLYCTDVKLIHIKKSFDMLNQFNKDYTRDFSPYFLVDYKKD